MNNFVIDAYAWIEYFNGTEIGQNVKAILENGNNNIFTNVITFSELASSYKRKSLSFDEEKKVLLSISKIYYLDNVDIAQEVGVMHAEIKKQRKHMGWADVFVLFTAKKLNAKVITGDEDFRGLKEAIMLK